MLSVPDLRAKLNTIKERLRNRCKLASTWAHRHPEEAAGIFVLSISLCLLPLAGCQRESKKPETKAKDHEIASVPRNQAVGIASPAIEPAKGFYYVVRGGETLAWIASNYRTTVEALAAANRLSPKQALTPGQRIFIPGQPAKGKGDAPAATEQTKQPRVYQVK